MLEAMNPKRREAYARRWRELCHQTANLDFEKASLAHEIREEFPAGASGDFQFRRWVMETFDVAASTAAKLFRAARAFRRFKREEWLRLGGWPGVSLAVSLGTNDLNRLMVAVRARAIELGRNLTYHNVRTIAFDLGIKSRNPGRPSHTESEQKLGFLRSWIKKLYRTYNLPEMPEHVAKAMNMSKLQRLARAAG